MAWFGIYIAIAAVVALTVFVASNWLRQEYLRHRIIRA
mgnify:CR=1 FL=1